MWEVVFALVYVVIGCLTITLLLLFVVNSRYSPLKPLSRPESTVVDPHAVRGEQGERLVKFFHLNTLPRDEYTSYHGLVVPADTAIGTTEVDHIVVSQYGVFVVETKAWTGRIDGGEFDRKWRVGNSNQPDERHNPIRQNRGHVAALSSFLGLPHESLRSVIFFTKPEAWFTKSQPDNVLQTSGLIDYIVGFRDTVLEAGEVERVNARLTALLTGSE